MWLHQTSWYKNCGKETYSKAIEIYGAKKVNKQKAIEFNEKYIEISDCNYIEKTGIHYICQDKHLIELIMYYWKDRLTCKCMMRKYDIVMYCKECLENINRRCN